jgi:caa(3)-type oxidase subunit IV
MDGTMSLRGYWTIWLALLVLTIVMIAIEAMALPTGLTILVLAGAMLTKATLIVGWFMHLKFETRFVMLCIVLGTLGTAVFLVFLLMPDGVDANRLADFPQ